jgi:hypothetical protein
MGLLDPGEGVVSGLLRGKPNMPAFQPIDPAAEQKKAIAGNQAALPAAETLAGGVNLFNQQQLEQMLSSSIPMYEQLKGQISSTISDEIAGKLPNADVQQYELGSVAKAFGGGYAGSPAMGKLVARDLGLADLQLTQQGLSQGQQWLTTMNNIMKPGFFNVSSMFLTPQQYITTDIGERNAQFQHDWAKNVMDWQSSAAYLGAGEMDQMSSQWNEIAGSAAGSALGVGLGGMNLGGIFGGGGGGSDGIQHNTGVMH